MEPEARTARLLLRLPAEADLDALHDLMSDPRVWSHFPEGRYRARAETEAMIERIMEGWRTAGQDHWIAHEAAGGALVGVGGPDLRAGVAWNLYYRLRPEQQGRRLARELAIASVERARAMRPELPIVASLLEHNTRSRRTAEGAGLEARWRGPSSQHPGSVRLLLADRELPEAVLRVFAR